MEKELRRATLIKELEETGIMMKSVYSRKEVEAELRDFQKQLVSKVFEEAHGRELRIDDVQVHINELAVEKGVEQSNEIVKFNERTEKLKILIAKEIAGNKGERHMKKTLKMIKEKNRFLVNLELSDDDFVSEIDGVVITRKAIFLLETKYSVKNMMITMEGNYVESENPHNIYCNLGEKVNTKEYLLRMALKKAGFDKDIKIEKIVVFSNNRKELSNKFSYISSCYCSQLPHIIDEYDGDDIYSLEDIDKISAIFCRAQSSREYKLNFDFNEYRFVFADALAITEMAYNEASEGVNEHKSVRWNKVVKYGAMTAGLILFAMIRGKR